MFLLMLGGADVGVVTTRPGIAHASFPSRIYGLMAAARPVVAALDTDSDPAELIRRAQCGLVVEPGNAEEIAQAILNLRADETIRKQMGENGRQHLVENYSKHTVGASYAALLRQLAER